MHPKYKLIKKTENPIINKTELNKKLILKINLVIQIFIIIIIF